MFQWPTNAFIDINVYLLGYTTKNCTTFLFFSTLQRRQTLPPFCPSSAKNFPTTDSAVSFPKTVCSLSLQNTRLIRALYQKNTMQEQTSGKCLHCTVCTFRNNTIHVKLQFGQGRGKLWPNRPKTKVGSRKKLPPEVVDNRREHLLYNFKNLYYCKLDLVDELMMSNTFSMLIVVRAYV